MSNAERAHHAAVVSVGASLPLTAVLLALLASGQLDSTAATMVLYACLVVSCGLLLWMLLEFRRLQRSKR